MGKKSRIKKQQQTQTQQQPNPWQSYLSWAVFVGLCVLVFYPPYFRAMFFTREQLPTHIFTLILFILWWVVKTQRKDTSFLSTPLDYAVFAFAAIYFLTLPIAINTRGAIQEFLKVTNYFLVYWLAREVIQTKKEATILLNVLVFSALGVAILGLGAAAGTWEVAGGYEGGRIFSTLQYPNSLAAYLTAAMLLTIGLLQNASLKLKRVYIVVAFLLLITTLLTYSRGGWMVLPVFSLLYVIFIPREKRAESLCAIGIIFSLGVILLPVLGRLYLAERGALTWLTIFTGSLFVLAFQYLSTNLITKVKPAFILGAIIVFFGIVITGTAIYASRTLSQPLRLAHTRAEADSSKILEERLPLTPDTEYTLAMRLLAEGDDEAPYFWRITITGRDTEGTISTLLNEHGKLTEDWEEKEFTFTTPENVSQGTIRLINHYTNTSVEVEEVVLVSPNAFRDINFVWYRLMPPTFYNRFIGLSVADINVQTRFRYTRDAWQIVKDHPILGLGGQGWKSRYFQYQSANYSSTEVHNHFMQVWVETGTVGLLIFLGIWLSFLHTAYNVYRNTDTEKKVMAVATATAVFTVVAHSLYDFNLSLGAIGIFLWALLGVIQGLDKERQPEPVRDKQLYTNYLALGVSIILLVFVWSLRVGHSNYVTGSNLVRAGEVSSSAATLERAVKFDRYDPDIRATLAYVYENMAARTQNIDYFNKASEQYQKAIALNRYNPRFSHEYGAFLVRSGEFNEGFDYLKKTIELQPHQPQLYNFYARTLLNVSQYLISQDQVSVAQNYIARVFPLEDQLAQYADNTRDLAFALGQAHFMLGNLEEAIEYLEVARGVIGDRAEAAMVLSLIYEQKGDSERALQHYDEAVQWNPASVETYENLKIF